MKALVKMKKGADNIEIRDVSAPVPGDDEVLIKVYYGGICGTDIHIQKDEFPYYPPVILGHEFSGVIEETGKNVNKWGKGDRVVSELHTLSCRSCSFCRTGNPQACNEKKAPGWGIDGAFAEYIKMPAWLLHEVPDNVPLKEAALAEPAAISAHALFQRINMEVGDFVVILGPGPIGLILAQLAKIKGAADIMITGVNKDIDNRLSVAERLGIDYVVNSEKEDAVEKINKLTDNGADLVLEAAGVESTINQAFEMVKWSGKIGVLGLPGEDKLNIKWTTGAFKSIDINFSFSSNYQDWKQVLGLLGSEQLNLEILISDIYSLQNWKEAFNKVKSGKAVKALFEINEE